MAKLSDLYSDACIVLTAGPTSGRLTSIDFDAEIGRVSAVAQETTPDLKSQVKHLRHLLQAAELGDVSGLKWVYTTTDGGTTFVPVDLNLQIYLEDKSLFHENGMVKVRKFKRLAPALAAVESQYKKHDVMRVVELRLGDIVIVSSTDFDVGVQKKNWLKTLVTNKLRKVCYGYQTEGAIPHD